MRLPNMSYEPEKVRREMGEMGGLNWSDRHRDWDLADSLHVSARRWPVLTTQPAREEQKGYSAVTALAAHGQLVAVRGTDLLLDGEKVGTVMPGEKRFAVVNTKLVIWPDMVCLDLESRKVEPMAAKRTLSAMSVSFTEDTLKADTTPVMVHGTPTAYDDEEGWYTVSGPGFDLFGGIKNDTTQTYHFRRCEAIERTAAGWALTGEETVDIQSLKTGDLVRLSSWDESNTLLASVWGSNTDWSFDETCYAVITGVSARVSYSSEYAIQYDVVYCPLRNDGKFTDCFKAGDAVTISGAGGNDKESAIIRAVTDAALTFTSDSFTPGQAEGSVTVERKVPPLEFICGSQNRLWGCGGNTIWASALGDPANFYVYDGLSTDSYSVAVGEDGDFTGCIGYSEGVLFWKEDRLYKVLGTYPSNYELHTYSVPGVLSGSDKSQVVLDDVLYYLSERGVYAYAGGVPRPVSACFGERRLTQGVAGTDGERYFLSAREGDKRHLLVYDPKKGLWLREDNTAVTDFARLGNRLYFAGADGSVWLVDGGGEDPGQEWMAQFTPFRETVLGRKRYTRLLLRLELPRGSWVIAETRQDGGPWIERGKAVGRTEDVVSLRLPVNRGDKFELRLRGKGPCGVLSVMREFTVGSER